MRFLQILIGIFSLCLFTSAYAIQITDVRTVDKTYATEDIFSFSYNLADYGFDAERDTLFGRPTLTFEFRDPTYTPEKDVFDRPFVSLFIDQGRGHMRVFNEDWIVNNGLVWFNEEGLMTAYLKVEGEVWLGDVTLDLAFTPGPDTQVPEPGPLTLMILGLLAVVIHRHKITL